MDKRANVGKEGDAARPEPEELRELMAGIDSRDVACLMSILDALNDIRTNGLPEPAMESGTLRRPNANRVTLSRIFLMVIGMEECMVGGIFLGVFLERTNPERIFGAVCFAVSIWMGLASAALSLMAADADCLPAAFASILYTLGFVSSLFVYFGVAGEDYPPETAMPVIVISLLLATFLATSILRRRLGTPASQPQKTE